MARSVWSGTLSFALVSVPVNMYSAVNPKGLQFKQVNKATGNLVKQQRVDAVTGDPVSEVIKGFPLGDQLVTIDPDEIDALRPAASKRIEIDNFVEEGAIDPTVYAKAYLLAPAAGAERAYRMLADAVSAQGKVAIGRVVMRSKQYLCAIRVNDVGVFVCCTTVWPDEVNDALWIAAQLAGEAHAPSAREVAMARALVDTFSEPFAFESQRDTFREKAMQLILARAAGEEVKPEEPAQESDGASDLMAALEASLKAAGEGVADALEKVAA